MDYIENALKISIKYSDAHKEWPLPYAYLAAFELREVFLGSLKAVFAKPFDDSLTIDNLKKRIKYISHKLMLPVVLILEHILPRQREALIAAGIPFVVANKQIYLPFLGVLLQERYEKSFAVESELTPSSQLVFLYYIYSNEQKLYLKDLRNPLQLSAMSLSRAAKQLEALDILNVGKDGVQKYICSSLGKKEILQKNYRFLTNPVAREVYVERDSVNETFCIAGDSALANYSMLSEPSVPVYAVKNLQGITACPELLDSQAQVKIQIWNYDPKILASPEGVDKISLALSYSNETDERVEKELEILLENL